MSRFGPLGWALLAVAVLAIVAAPHLLSVPEPVGAMVLDRATFLSGDGPPEQVDLPHVVNPGAGKPHSVRYLVDFDLPVVPDDGPHLLLPLLNRRVLLEIAGETFYDSGYLSLWIGPAVSTTALVRIPRRGLVAGQNRLALTIEVDRFIVPMYLSRLYLGSAAELAPSFKWWSFLDQMRIMSLAAQVLLAAGLILAFFFRPGDVLISWLAALEAVVVPVTISMSIGFHPAVRELLPFAVALVPAYGLLCVGVALALLGRRPPGALRFLILGVTCLLVSCAIVGTPPARMISAIFAVFFLVTGVFGATAVIGWGALRQGNIDARFMLAPALLLSAFLVRDGYIVATLPDHPFSMLSSHIGLVYVVTLIAVLARQEQVEATRLTREQERHRLTHDLHDGLSGHLASIIALSERAESKPIEEAAREALNDLRLVIYSLDLGDSDLPLALANLRERLIPQLQRLGVELEWSMANLPEISGVTPGNALTVLRILQEAITNALRHGPARRIAIRGSVSDCGRAAIVIENDGRAFVASSGGRGLENMRRRAAQLHATFEILATDNGTAIRLLLPLRLTDIQG